MKAALQSIAIAFAALLFWGLATILSAIPYAIAFVIGVMFLRSCA